MRRRPSPSLVVSIIALVFAAAGTSIAAVNFAKNAGAVDGKSAVGAASSSSRAAGKLVATANKGSLRGKVPARFLDLSGVVTGGKLNFGQGIEVQDNGSAAPVAIGGLNGLGLVTATCIDQNKTAAKEDPQVTLTFANSSGTTVSYVRSIGITQPVITAIPAAGQASFTVNNSNTFRIYVQAGSTNYVMDGVVRQDAPNTAAAICSVYGYAVVL